MHHIYELSMFHCLNFFFKDCFVNVRQSFVFTFVTKRSRLTKPKFMTLGMCGLIISIRDSESHLVKSCYLRIVLFRTEIPQTLTVGHSWQTRQPHIYNDSLTDGLAWYKTPEVLKFTASQMLFFTQATVNKPTGISGLPSRAAVWHKKKWDLYTANDILTKHFCIVLKDKYLQLDQESELSYFVIRKIYV